VRKESELSTFTDECQLYICDTMEANVPEPLPAQPSLEADSVATVSQALGARIRIERERAGLSLRELARRANVSHSLISQIERGNVTPSVATLWALASELGLLVADLFGDVEEARRGARGIDIAGPGTPGPVQPHQTRTGVTLEGGVRWERLTSTYDEDVDFIQVVYPVGSASCGEDALMRHNGKEFGYVISGRLGVRIGFQEFEVGPDDSISFNGVIPHRLWTIGDEPVRAIWWVLRPGQPLQQRTRTSGPDSDRISGTP
jgi:transcriptional regulator with XRE-family HTH domain